MGKPIIIAIMKDGTVLKLTDDYDQVKKMYASHFNVLHWMLFEKFHECVNSDLFKEIRDFKGKISPLPFAKLAVSKGVILFYVFDPLSIKKIENNFVGMVVFPRADLISDMQYDSFMDLLGNELIDSVLNFWGCDEAGNLKIFNLSFNDEIKDKVIQIGEVYSKRKILNRK